MVVLFVPLVTSSIWMSPDILEKDLVEHAKNYPRNSGLWIWTQNEKKTALSVLVKNGGKVPHYTYIW